MKDAGILSEEYYLKPQMMLFQRAARTDKGVSAVRQVVSLKIRKCLKCKVFFWSSICYCNYLFVFCCS